MSSPNQSPAPAYNRRVSHETRASTCLAVNLKYSNLRLLLCSNKQQKMGVDVTQLNSKEKTASSNINKLT